MSKTSLQITVRGLDDETKSALVKKARARGVSLNQYALTSLKQAAGIETSEERYRRFSKLFVNARVSPTEAKAFDEAIEWLNKTSLEKQKRDEHDFGL